jgi:hypothetical protein
MRNFLGFVLQVMLLSVKEGYANQESQRKHQSE